MAGSQGTTHGRRPDSAALQSTPRPQQALGGFPFEPTPSLPRPWEKLSVTGSCWRGLGTVCWGTLTRGFPRERTRGRARGSPIPVSQQIRLLGTLIGNSTQMGPGYLTDAVQRSVQATLCGVLDQQALLSWRFLEASWPAVQRAQPIKVPRRCKWENGASGCSEDSSPLEGASSPPLSEADPPRSWNPGTASVSSHTLPAIQDVEGLHISR